MRSLFILLVEENTNIIGIAPFYIEKSPSSILKIRRLYFLGYPECGSDYLDVIIKRGYEKEVSELIYDFLMSERDWDIMELCPIHAQSVFFLYLYEKMEQQGKYIHVKPSFFCPVTVLPQNTDDFFASLSNHRRQQFRRHLNLLRREGAVGLITYSSGGDGDLTGELQSFFTIYEKSRALSKSFTMFLQKFFIRIHERGNPYFQLDFLTFNDKYIAGLLHLKYNDILYLYSMAVDKAFRPQISIGNLIIGMAIEKAIRENIKIYDFLRGTEHYKFHWSNRIITQISIRFYKRGFAPLLISAWQFCKSLGKIILR
ncbi:MAG: GNAT family N-acetyltransferase [Thermodesulfovibrionales bacterium]|nr:GNAT family N-acetyltransferase [Thermodesulfovibrionales bacterium]